jgi:hypothetical protein
LAPRISFWAMLFAMAVPYSMAFAQDTLSVLLTDGTKRHLSLEELDSFRQVAFSTTTIWIDAEVRFSGVPISVILDETGAEGRTLRLTALNDYIIEMPVDELDADAPIVATRMNGETMPVRGKGPFWVMYPFDEDPAYSSEVNYSRSVWQLVQIALRD